MIATHPYKGEDDDELSFETGEVIYVVEYDDPEEQVRNNKAMVLVLGIFMYAELCYIKIFFLSFCMQSYVTQR